MKTSFSLAAVCLFLLLRSASAESNLSVVFVHPEDFSDASYSSSFANAQDRAAVQRDIEQHLKRLAERTLPLGDSLKIEVLDIDLAGRVEPFRFRIGSDVRVMRDISGPRMDIRYTLTRKDQATSNREERLSALHYLSSFNRYPGGDRLRYEKAMLDRWFVERFGQR